MALVKTRAHQSANHNNTYSWITGKPCAQGGKNLGREADGEGGVARGSGVCRESRYRQVSAARPSPDLCTALPHSGRGTGANPVPARSHFDSDNRTLSRLQTADSRCCQRQNRNRATGLNEPLTVRFAELLACNYVSYLLNPMVASEHGQQYG